MAFGSIPTEQDYGKQYKQVSVSEQSATFVGIKVMKVGEPTGVTRDTLFLSSTTPAFT